eukprot:gnl/MRDRNA2_/MRDRNA2_83491_c0_seq1.p1 gnl/MRDRNA2_/MRDRNA2_83491_c0~~gnl/MRDRNA2_/MRDRNA2_83491_c0_seq1.p1  ORF type:complete len:341 (+),score=73.23 gnl/MRDRNA2_/MRDRNA2_83491_c0_seq1:50-1072(+)
MLGHVILNIPEYNETYRKFWMDTLGFVSDTRAKDVSKNMESTGGSMKGLVWANIGLQQVQMPIADPDEPVQILRGHIGIDYPKIDKLKRKLKRHEIEHRWGREEIRQLGGAADHLQFKDPQGNLIRAYQQDKVVMAGGIQSVWYGPSGYLLPHKTKPLPGGETMGLGLRYVQFDVPKGAAKIICQTYRKYFRTKRFGPPQLHEESGSSCEVPMGHHQYLQYEEVKENAMLPRYDGHFIAIYINKFADVYKNLKEDDLIYNNPRFPHLTYDTLDDAMKHAEFRFKDFVDLKTGKVVYTLEHEVRSLAHKQYPKGLTDANDALPDNEEEAETNEAEEWNDEL